MRRQRVERDRKAIELAGERLGAIEAAIRDDHAVNAIRMQMARGECNRFASADEQRGVLFEFLEHRPSDLHSRGGHGHRIRTNACVRSHALRDRERGLKQTVQLGPGRARVERRAIGVFQLSEDLGFAQDERVETARNIEEVLDRLGAV